MPVILLGGALRLVADVAVDPESAAGAAQADRLQRHSFESRKADPAAPGLLLGNARIGGCLAASGLGIPKLWGAELWANAELRLSVPGPMLACDSAVGLPLSEYRQALSLRDGVAFTEARYGTNAGYAAEIFCSMADPGLMVMRVTPRGGAIGRWSVEVPTEATSTNCPSSVLTGKSAAAAFTPFAWTMRADRPLTHAADRRYTFALPPGGHATFAFRLVAGGPAAGPGAGTEEGSFDALLAAHRAAWDALWRQCAVLALPDPALERLWYRSVYWTISTCGSDRYLPGESMFCVPCWNMHPFTYGAAGWAAQALTSLGLPARAKAMLDCHLRPDALRDNARFYTRALVAADPSADAMAFAHEVRTDGRNIPCGHYELQRHLDGFGAALFYRHQRFYPEESYSKAELYPLLKGLAEMWCGIARRDNGASEWVLPRMTSLTEDLVAPHPIDAALAAKWCLLAACRESEALGLDADRRERWRETAEHLLIPQGDQRYLEYAGDQDQRPGGGYQGVRGFVYLGYPTMELIPTLDREKALRTLDHTWERNRKGEGMIGFVASWFALADLHYGRGDHALEILRHNLRCEDAWQQGVSECPGNGNYHFTTGYASCLLVPLAMAVQSFDDRIASFCAVPSAWKDFAFYRVPAESGVRVSGAMRDGSVQWLRYSRGGRVLRKATAREAVRVRGDGGSLELLPARE